ncbi:sugar nucleotide-binding protein, partial [Candidatus Parvarchaeota archaeon]|nr:sugar nucleotide-binding protein [Candidatus Acidifodinimicrobium mancum]
KEHFSRYKFAMKIADVFNFDKSLIKETSLDSFNLAAKRPKNTFLNVDEISKFFEMKAVEDNLRNIKQQMGL